MNSIPRLLKESHQKWIEVVNEGDIDAYSALLTEDAVWIPPNSKPIEGRIAFKNWLTPFVAKFDYQFDISEVRFIVADNRALERAGFTSEMSPKSGGDSMIHSGTFTALWINEQESNWCIERYIDDTNL